MKNIILVLFSIVVLSSCNNEPKEKSQLKVKVQVQTNPWKEVVDTMKIPTDKNHLVEFLVNRGFLSLDTMTCNRCEKYERQAVFSIISNAVITNPTNGAFVRRTVRQLGIDNRASLKTIFETARSQGLGLCTPGEAVVLRMFYSDQPIGTKIFIAMSPIEISSGIGEMKWPAILALENNLCYGNRLSYDGGCWENCPDEMSHWHSGYEFVFKVL